MNNRDNELLVALCAAEMGFKWAESGKNLDSLRDEIRKQYAEKPHAD